MKKKTVLSFALALALMVTVIGTATSAFAATSAPMEPVTKIATENEDAIWEQIEAIEEKSDAIFQRNAALWEKLDEICNALPDDYDFTNFDEAAFIRSTNALTEAEKETLLADIKELNELDAQMEALYDQLPDILVFRNVFHRNPPPAQHDGASGMGKCGKRCKTHRIILQTKDGKLIFCL